jgi:hypothetical protein
MQRYETNHRKRVVEENLNQFWSNKFLPKTYSPSFGGCRKLSRNDLQRVGTNTWVSSLRILQADTPTRLS